MPSLKTLMDDQSPERNRAKSIISVKLRAIGLTELSQMIASRLSFRMTITYERKVVISPPYRPVQWVLRNFCDALASDDVFLKQTALVLLQALDDWERTRNPKDARERIFKYLDVPTIEVLKFDGFEVMIGDEQASKNYYAIVNQFPHLEIDNNQSWNEFIGETGKNELTRLQGKGFPGKRTQDGPTGQMPKPGSWGDGRRRR